MNSEDSTPIRVLMVEDLEPDAELALHSMRRAGLTVLAERVDSEAALRRALLAFEPAVILSDFDLPGFDGYGALAVARELAPQVPFIFVSGKMGEERAIDALHRGVVDYVLKSNLSRLAPAVRRAVRESSERQSREAHIARLDRVLRMLSGINGAVVRIRDRAELLRESCRLGVSVGGYSAVVASAKVGGNPQIQPVAWYAGDEALGESLRSLCAEALSQQNSLLGRALSLGRAVVCNETAARDRPGSVEQLLWQVGLRSIVALPLAVDGTGVGVLLFAARDTQVVGDEELRMLQEVGGNLSFAWQFMQKDNTVRFLSLFDSQTALAKRSLFGERLERLLDPKGKRRHALLAIDIEKLGVINDSFGRRTGDLLLQHVAARLKQHVPRGEQLAHLGGGTFALVDERPTESTDEMLASVAAHLQALFHEPLRIEEREIPVAVRCGVALHPQDANNAEALLQRAESALLHARTTGAPVVHFNAERHSQRVGRLAMEHRLRLALERSEFELHYQPKVNVITRRIQGVEALIRWRDPQGGLISPGAFLPIVESTGLGAAVGDWVIEQAARDCRAWQHTGLPPVRVAVNVSPTQLQRADFTQHFLKAVEPWSNSIWGLDIEVTEAALNEESGEEIQKLKLLRRTGVKIAIDDFGTGYSSLGRLSQLPIDVLKIDSCFIRQTPDEAAGRAVVKTIVTLARAFGLSAVAEGVEKQAQLDFLWHVACNQSQGYLHSKPVSADEFAWLLEHGSGKLILAAESAEAQLAALEEAAAALPVPDVEMSEG
ncbi:MAG TPA: EAL domain-containing protein [Steroidobacteraceae bacterium]|nr:EAL domain-containing protein [Steroidobacteraceae bacterium]